MATARRAGTNEQVTSYGGGGRDYTSFSTWEAATDTDHVTDEETDVLECYDDSATFDDELNAAGSTNDATYFRIIRAASGEGHDGTTESGFHINSTNDSNTIILNEDYTQAQDIIIQTTINGTATRASTYLRGANVKLIGCFVRDAANSGSGNCRGVFAEIGGDPVMVLTAVVNGDYRGIQDSGITTYAYNCVVYNNATDGFRAGSFVCKNTISDSNGASNFESGTYTGSDYNASSDTTDTGGTNDRTEQTITYVDSANGDFHLDDADEGALGFGQTLASDGTFAFDDDINDGTMGGGKAGETFQTWDIGFDEPEEAAGEGSDTFPGWMQSRGGWI